MDQSFIITVTQEPPVSYNVKILYFITDYYQELILAAIPGVINSFQSMKETKEFYPHLPLLKLHTYPLFWVILVLFDFFAVSILFWFLYSLSSRPGFFSIALLQAIVFGFGFINISRSKNIDLLVLNDLNFNSVYVRSKQYLYDSIEDKESINTASFWMDIRKELENKKETDYIDRILSELSVVYEVKIKNKQSNSLTNIKKERDFVDLARSALSSSATQDLKVGTIILLFQGMKSLEIKKTLVRYGFNKVVKTYY